MKSGTPLAQQLRHVPRANGFSLVEVLLAIFILGIGLIMIATIFPVGANWTRQTTEDTVAQTIAQNAISVIKSHYGPQGNATRYVDPDYNNTSGNSLNSVLLSADPFVLQPFPGLTDTTVIALNERCFEFGSSNPFPADNPLSCTYFWTAVCRLNPSQRTPLPNAVTRNIAPTSAYKYDVFILVFRKGAIEQTFTPPPSTSTYLELVSVPSGATTAQIMRNTPAENFIPMVLTGPYSSGDHDPAKTPSVFGAVPAIGGIGIGIQSGTVFRNVIDPGVNMSTAGTGGAMARPSLVAVPGASGPVPERILFSAPADGSSSSPLIYVYQTTLTL